MSLPAPTIRIFFGLPASGGDWFTLNDPVRGLLNSVYRLAGDLGTEVQASGYDIEIRRGRARWMDDNETGTCEVQFRNYDRHFDPLHGDTGMVIDSNGDGFIDVDESEVSTPTAPYFGRLRPGKRIQVEVDGARLFDGATESWDVTYTAHGEAWATLSAEDDLGTLARREFDEWTTTDGQTAGERIVDVLNRGDVRFGANRDISDGVSTLEADLVTWGSNVLNYTQLVARSDLGNVFVSRDGVLTFRDRHDRFTADLAMAFGDTGDTVTVYGETGPVDITTVPIVDLQLSSGSTLLFNRVGVDRADPIGGPEAILQTVEDETSIDEVGIRSLNVSEVLLDSDGASLSMAEYLLGLFRTPKERVSAITVNLDSLDDTQRGLMLRLDIDDMVTIDVTPLGVGTVLQQSLFVEGVEHSIPVGGPHMMTLRTSLADAAAPFRLNDPVYGLLNGVGVLTY